MNILLPIDGSECSRNTLAWAARTFDKRSTEFYLLHVIPVLPDLNTVEYDIMDATVILNNDKAYLEAQGCTVAKAEYVLGDPTEQICRYADAMAMNQVIIGSHGRTGLSKLLMGSTSIRVMEHCVCPVIILRHSPMPVKHKQQHSALGETLF